MKELYDSLFVYKDGDLYGKDGKKAGRVDSQGYVVVRVKGKDVRAHRVIFCMHHGFVPSFVDHADGNKTNNKIENLRQCSISENSTNKKLGANNTSGAKGVSWHKATGKWQVNISVNKRQRNFGYFEDFEFAELVAVEARNKYHGCFARHK